MRVLMTTHYWWPHVGGIERVALRQAELLVGRGHEVSVLSSAVGQTAGGEAAGTDRGKIASTLVPAWNGLERVGVPWPVFSPRLANHASRLVDWSDVIVCHGHVYPATLAVLRRAVPVGKPVVLVQHNPRISYRGAALRAGQWAADASVGRWALRSADVVVVPSRATARYVASIASVTARILPWGIEHDRYRPHSSAAERQAERHRLGVPEGAVLVVAAGRLAEKNRFDLLVRACASARAVGQLRCVVLGSGPLSTKLHHEAEALGAPVTFAGRVDDDLMQAYLRSADMAVATAGSNEGFGLLVAEALASGTPVVVASKGGQADLVVDGVNGWCFDGTAEGLSDTLGRAAGEVARLGRPAWSERAHRSVEHLRWDVHAAALEGALDALRRHPRPTGRIEGLTRSGRRARWWRATARALP